MFDTVDCEFLLDDKRLPQKGWQTKSLDCNLDTYTIMLDGRLKIDEYDMGDKEKPAKDKFLDFTGEFTMHNEVKDQYQTGRHEDDWIDLRVRFEHGYVAQITRVSQTHREMYHNPYSGAYQRGVLKDLAEKLIDKDEMAVKWKICGEYNSREQPIYIEKREGFGGTLFAITTRGNVMSIKGEWEIEPTPSSRTDAFLEQCRFDTFDEAYITLKKYWRNRYPR